MEAHGAGWTLRAARAELGLTEDGLAREMRRWAELRGEPRPDITADAVADWEAGVRPLDLATSCLLWLVLEVPSWDRVELAAATGVDTWSLFRPSRPVADGGQRRRELLHAVVALREPSGLDTEQLVGALEEALRVDRNLVEGLTRAARRFPKEWGRGGAPQVLRRRIHGHLQIVHALLDGVMGGGSRRELESAAANAATVAGLIAIVVDQPEDAAIYLQLAHRLAGSAGDTEAHALALMFASHLVSVTRPDASAPDPARARALVEEAMRLVSPVTAPHARAWVLLRAAGEYASGGDELRAFRLLDEAERLSSSGPAPADGMLSPWTADTHLTFRGEVAAMCGRYGEAVALLETGLSRLGPDRVATRPRALADLAAAHARQGSVDHACALLSEAFELARWAGIPERVARISGIRRRHLAGHESEPAVRRLDEQLLTR
jgi:tetratricopeptide (TPR) repeat protein